MTAAVVFGVRNRLLGLLRQTLRPKLVLRECIEDWHNISLMLRESSRRRQLQMEKILVKWPSLS